MTGLCIVFAGLHDRAVQRERNVQLSLDGRRLSVTNSLYSSWDNQFSPGFAPGS